MQWQVTIVTELVWKKFIKVPSIDRRVGRQFGHLPLCSLSKMRNFPDTLTT